MFPTELAKNKVINCPLCRSITKGSPDEIESNELIKKLNRFVTTVSFYALLLSCFSFVKKKLYVDTFKISNG